MRNLIIDIIEYSNYLKKNYGISVSFIYDHFPQKYFELLYPCIEHDSKYCEAYKKTGLMNCVRDKYKLLEKNVKRPIVGRCHAGVCQLVFPVRTENKTVNLVLICEHRSVIIPDFEKICEDSNLSAADFKNKYYSLSLVRPSFNELKPKINPLLRMLELYYHYSKDFEDRRINIPENQLVYEKAAGYILANFKNNLTLEDVCKYCNYSPTFLNNIFKKHRNMTIKQYIIYLKMKQASQILLTTNKTVSEISEILGYNDSNYFTNQFKKHYKMSPRYYRKNG